MASRTILIIGGHGKIAQLLTPLLLQRSWNVTSLIRSEDQVDAIRKLGEGSGVEGKLSVLVQSLADVRGPDQAQSILDQVNPDTVVWTAGAGGKYGPELTYAIDRDAAQHFVSAAVRLTKIKRFILVSYIGSRRKPAPWWTEASVERFYSGNKALATYYQAKLPPDELLYRLSRTASVTEDVDRGFAGIVLRPATLTMEPAGGVDLGKTQSGKVSRDAVAKTIVELAEVERVGSVWLDMLDGDEEIGEAVRRVVSDKVDAAEGDDIYMS